MRYVLIVLAIFVAPLAALAAALYAFDPLQLFHKPWGRELAFSNQMQLQAAGLLRTYDYDGLILGTSMLENTSGEEAGRLLGGRFLNVSLSGSMAFERSYLLRFALQAGRVKHVVFLSTGTRLGWTETARIVRWQSGPSCMRSHFRSGFTSTPSIGVSPELEARLLRKRVPPQGPGDHDRVEAQAGPCAPFRWPRQLD